MNLSRMLLSFNNSSPTGRKHWLYIDGERSRCSTLDIRAIAAQGPAQRRAISGLVCNEIRQS